MRSIVALATGSFMSSAKMRDSSARSRQWSGLLKYGTWGMRRNPPIGQRGRGVSNLPRRHGWPGYEIVRAFAAVAAIGPAVQICIVRAGLNGDEALGEPQCGHIGGRGADGSGK